MMPEIIDLSTPPQSNIASCLSPTTTSQKSTEASPASKSAQPLHAISLEEDGEEDVASFSFSHTPPIPTPSPFIHHPEARVRKCIEVLCGNVGIVTEHFLALKIGQVGVNDIQRDVIEMLSPRFYELIKLPQSDQSEAAARYLEPLQGYMDRKGVYLHVIQIPPHARFWKQYPGEYDNLDVSKPCVLLYVGSTIRSFRLRIEKEHMRAKCRRERPSLHYAAMDEPGSKDQWFLLTRAEADADQAIIRIAEATAIACLHTYTSTKYSDILTRYGIVETTSVAKGLNRSGGMRDWGFKTMESAVQIVLYQRLLEQYGGDPWTFESLPLVVSNWLSTQETKKDIQKHLERVVRDGTSLSEAFNRVMGLLGAKACQDVRFAISVQKVLSGGTFHLGSGQSNGEVHPAIWVFSLPAILLRSCHAKVGDEVAVNFIVSDETHPLRYALGALQKDQGRRLAILMSGVNSDGVQWNHWVRVKGDKAAMRANTYFDYVTGTGSALKADRVPRRCYTVRDENLSKSGHYNYHHEYTGQGGSSGTDLAKALESMDRAENQALQRDHEGQLVETTLETSKQSLGPKSETLKRKAPPNETAVASSRMNKKVKVSESRPQTPMEFVEEQAFSEADYQEILGNTDLFECFGRWVLKQGSSYKPLKTATKSSHKIAACFRAEIEDGRTCSEPLKRLNGHNLAMVYVRLCKMKQRDDEEALL